MINKVTIMIDREPSGMYNIFSKYYVATHTSDANVIETMARDFSGVEREVSRILQDINNKNL